MKLTKHYNTIFLVLLISLCSIFTFELHAVESILGHQDKYFGDFEKMSARNTIRVLVPYSKTFYFLDGANQKGFTYDFLQEFEKYINNKLKRGTIKIRIIVIPTLRDQLIPSLLNGTGDIAAGNLTITPKRERLIDFSIPYLTEINEIIVTSPKTQISSMDNWSPYIRKSSSYYESITSLNRKLLKLNKTPVSLQLGDEQLEDEDILEMMNANMIQMSVIDSHKGEFWSKIFPKLSFNFDKKLRTGGQIAWAFRKDSPQLESIINEFMKKNKKGTLLGNILFSRYLKNTQWVENSLKGKEKQRLEAAIPLFKKYSNQYNFDWIMIASLAFQESKIDQSVKSKSGAIGVMQILPSTAADKSVEITNIYSLEPNIHAGTKYLRYIYDQFIDKEPMNDLNKYLFMFASYNAGPNRIRKLRNEAEQNGLDPNIWFRNVEIIAAKRIGRETVTYVSNIYKYYIAYSTIYKNEQDKEKVKESLKKSK